MLDACSSLLAPRPLVEEEQGAQGDQAVKLRFFLLERGIVGTETANGSKESCRGSFVAEVDFWRHNSTPGNLRCAL